MDGDNQRVRNQQKVFKAIIKRIISPKMITNYGKFMDALAVAFDTNLSNDEISDFIKYELNNMPDWKFESYSLVGDSDSRFCYASSGYASVIVQNEEMNEIARRKIQAILDGKKASSVKDTSGFSQKPSEDNSVGNAQEFAEMNNNSEETDEDYYTYEEPYYEANDEYYYQPEEPAEYYYSEDYAG